MKSILVILAFVVFNLNATAQTYVSSDKRQTCYWDDASQKLSVCDNEEAFVSMFTLNADETMFVHTTEKLKSSYYVKGKTFNSEADVYTYDVMSDVGNKYQFILGKSSVNFVILSIGHAENKDDYIMKFPIKKKWND